MSVTLRKVLIIERVAASPRSAEVLEEITRKHFASTVWAITFASDGIEALDQMNYTQFDLIIIWNTLPDISPVNFLRLIRKHGYSTPLVFYCDRSYYNNSTIEHAHSLGFHGVLPKPFTSKELCLTLSSATTSHLTVAASLPILTPAIATPTNKAIAEVPKPKRQRCRSPSPVSTAAFWDPMLIEALQLFEA